MKVISLYNKSDHLALSPHLSTSEYHCKCKNDLCRFTLVYPPTVKAFEMVRLEVGEPIYINSAFRCHTHNHNVGGARESQHLQGTALDLAKPARMGFFEFYEICQKHYNFTIPYEKKNFVHCDMR